MKQKTNRILAMLLSIILILGACLPVFADTTAEEAEKERYAQMLIQYLSDLTDDVEVLYKYGVTKEELLLSALKALIGDDVEKLKTAIGGVLNNLDEYSHFYTGEEYQSIKQAITGDKGIIGIQLQKQNDHYEITGLVEGTPAEGAGIQAGDILLSVDGKSISDKTVQELSAIFAGSPGTQVTLVIQRPGMDALLTYTLTRVAEVINPVTARVIDDSIQYIKIDTINGHSGEYFAKAMQAADEKKIPNIILDLRNNGGGLLSEAIKIVSHFLPKDAKVVSMGFKDEQYNVEYKSAGLGTRKYKLVVLVNGFTASASEVIAGALKDYEAGYVIGTKTFGKGAVQRFSDLNGLDSAMNLTIAHYLTPNGTDLHSIGLPPNMNVENRVIKPKEGEFIKFDYLQKPKLGDTGQQVLGIKQRLNWLGFNLPQDEVFDEQTEQAIYQFQQQVGLFPYGVADITTQVNLNTYAMNATKTLDDQLDYAIAYLKNVVQ